MYHHELLEYSGQVLGEYIKHFLLHVNRKRHRKRTLLNKILRYFRDTYFGISNMCPRISTILPLCSVLCSVCPPFCLSSALRWAWKVSKLCSSVKIFEIDEITACGSSSYSKVFGGTHLERQKPLRPWQPRAKWRGSGERYFDRFGHNTIEDIDFLMPLGSPKSAPIEQAIQIRQRRFYYWFFSTKLTVE